MTGSDQDNRFYTDQRNNTEDDGHTIADMSGLPARQPFFWRKDAGREDAARGMSGADAGRRMAGGAYSPDQDAPVYMHDDEDLSLKNRLSMVMGALGAALAIGLVYLVIFALVIFLLLLAWNR